MNTQIKWDCKQIDGRYSIRAEKEVNGNRWVMYRLIDVFVWHHINCQKSFFESQIMLLTSQINEAAK